MDLSQLLHFNQPHAPVAPSGIQIGVVPNNTDLNNNPVMVGIELQRSGGFAGWTTIAQLAPEELKAAHYIYEDPLPYDGTTMYSYRAREFAVGYALVDWGSASILTAKAIQGTYSQTPQNQRPTADYAALSHDPGGSTIESTVAQTDGANNFSLTKGLQQGAGQHNQAITFGTPFNSIPQVFLAGGLAFQQASKWSISDPISSSYATASFNISSSQYSLYSANNISKTGFTIRALLYQKNGATVSQSANFALGYLKNVSDTSPLVTLASAPASGDTYTVWVQLSGSLNAGSGVASSKIVISAQENSTGIYVSRGTTNITMAADPFGSDSADNAGSITFTQAGITSATDIRLSVDSITTTGAGAVANWCCRGHTSTDAPPGVQYNTTTQIYASKTPASDDSNLIQWQAVSYV